MLGLQNDRQNLSFVKATNVVGEKMAGNTCKMAISYLCHFRFETEFMYIVQNKREKNVRNHCHSMQWWNMDIDFAHNFENVTRLKRPSKIKPHL